MAKLINILLQKSDPEYPWGFSLGTQPPSQHSIQITWVDNGSLASEHLEPGDRVLEIEGIDTTMLTNAEVDSLLKSPSKKLELLIMKKPKVKISPSVFDSRQETIQKSEQVKNVSYEESHSRTIEQTGYCEEFQNKEKIDNFWTSPPPDLKEAVKTKSVKNDNFMSQSTIFKNLNKYKNETRKFDPREEKRLFWESCRKGDSIRRFKWGDSIKPARVTSPYAKSDGSTESLYFKSEKKTEFSKERSKSCEPTDVRNTNPFNETGRRLSPSNPFSAHYCEPRHKTIPEIKVTDETGTKESNIFSRESTQEEKILQKEITKSPPEVPARVVKKASKDDFNTKYEFFEKTMSVPISVNKNAKDLVEGMFKEGTSPVTRARETLPKEEQKAPQRRFSTPSNLKKPSDFINQNWKKDQLFSKFNLKIGQENNQNKHENSTKEQTQNFQTFTELSNQEVSQDTFGIETQKNEQSEQFKYDSQTNVNTTDNLLQQDSQNYECRTEQTNHLCSPARNADFYEPKVPQSTEDFHQNCDYSQEQYLYDETLKSTHDQKTADLYNQQKSYEQQVKNTGESNQNNSKEHYVYNASEKSAYDQKSEDFYNQNRTSDVQQVPQNSILNESELYASHAQSSVYYDQQSVEMYNHKSQIEDQPVPLNEQYAGSKGQYDNQKGYDHRSTDMYNQQKTSDAYVRQASQNSEQNTSHAQYGDVYNQKLQTSEDSFVQAPQNEQYVSKEKYFYDTQIKKNASKNHHDQKSQNIHDSKASQNIGQTDQSYVFSKDNHEQQTNLYKPVPEQNIQKMRTSKMEYGKEYEHKTRTFMETSYEKVTRSSSSPYENVESAHRREYKEEEIKPKSMKDRSKTPSGFYDNHFEEMYRESRRPEIHPETYENIRLKLGSLLGGTPVRPINKIEKRKKEERAESIEEAFRELAIKEGLMEDDSPEYFYYMRQSSQIAANGSNAGGNMAGGAPPPPPPPVHGNIPPVRIASEIGQKKQYEPPAAIQNAMMTKDKKPFTYTPGGLDLAEIRSPRMARRINRNAHMEDSCSQQPQQRPPGTIQQPLPPSALAAMQPQIAIPVFPPPVSSQVDSEFPPPPPPLPMSNSNMDSDFPSSPLQSPGTPTGAIGFPPPPPPPMPDAQNACKNGNRSPPSYINDIPNHKPLRSVGPVNQYRPPPSDFVAEIPCHPPLKPTNQPPRSSYDPSNASSIQVNLKPVSPKPAPVNNTGPPFIPVQPVYIQPKSPETLYRPQAPAQEPSHRPNPPLTMPTQSITQQQSPSPVLTPGKQTPTTPGSLNKSPAPWMTSRQQSKDSQAPWTVKPNQVESQPSQIQYQPPSGSVTRVIPIQFEDKEPVQQKQQSPIYQQQSPVYQQPPMYQQPPTVYQQTPVYQQQASPVYQQQASPVYQQQAPVYNQPKEEQGRTRIIPIQIEGAEPQRNYATQKSIPNQNSIPTGYGQSRVNQNSPHPENYQRATSVDGNRQLQSQNSWTQGTTNPIQSRSFRVLQKITGSEEEPTGPFENPGAETFLVNRVYPPQATAPVGADNNMCWDPNNPSPYYPNPNYWYYPPQTPEEQQKFWEHYNAMCAYMAQMNAAAVRFSPYPMYPYLPSEEEYSGYSSSDEMTYYGQMFKKQAEMQKQYYEAQKALENKIPESVEREEKSNNSEESDTDTEVEEECKPVALQSIKSVPNINVYNSESSESSSESESDEDEESDNEIPHQLSIIFEESEHSSDAESCKKVAKTYESDAGSSSSTLNNEDDESPVVVRLPLQFTISRSENDEEVTTVIVGNSQAAKSEEPESLIITEIIKEDSDPDVSVTINLKALRKNSIREVSVPKSNSESPTDFWKEIQHNPTKSLNETQSPISEDDSKHEESDYHWEDDSSSTSIQTVKKGMSESENEAQSNIEENPVEEEDNSEQKEINESSDETSEEDSDSDSSSSDEEAKESEVSENIEPIQKEKGILEKLKSMSLEESEEDDSGVTSDISRHISETDTGSDPETELKKMTRYQRAATHSRLFKLLQDECAIEEEEPLASRKERLTLPLNQNHLEQESLSSSSGINSPLSPTATDRLVKELVQSLLSRKKGRHFRKLPVEKLHAAALKILQEDMDPYDTSSDDSSFFLSPASNPHESNELAEVPNPETYGGNYYDYCKYYNTWANPDGFGPQETIDYEILPSKTFRILQDSQIESPKGIAVRCPRVSSSQNLSPNQSSENTLRESETSPSGPQET